MKIISSMKLVTYKNKAGEGFGLFSGEKVYNLHTVNPLIPVDMLAFLKGGDTMMEKALLAEMQIKDGGWATALVSDYQLLAPLPRPASCRDGYAFRQHVEAARRNRGLPMLPEFDEYPVFYFTNHQAISGPGTIYCMPDHFDRLDFELEIAVVIGKPGKNITAAAADNYIAGFMIMNDLSARTLQMEEMMLSLGPAKGKDFATATGPWLVTPDELSACQFPAKPGHKGMSYNLPMSCRVNGIEVSYGNMADMDWTFAELIERASYGCCLYPGDVIGSGTVGTGCFLELNGTAALYDKDYQPQWLQPGDLVEMEVKGLGELCNRVMEEESAWSILKLKK